MYRNALTLVTLIATTLALTACTLVQSSEESSDHPAVDTGEASGNQYGFDSGLAAKVNAKTDFRANGADAHRGKISVANADKLIVDGRKEIGLLKANCKVWAQNVTTVSYKKVIEPTDTAPTTDQYKWIPDADLSATVAATWLGSYANGRIGSITLAPSAESSLVITVPNTDPQRLLVYASTNKVTATGAVGGVTKLTVTSTSTDAGNYTPGTAISAGTWTIKVKNTDLVNKADRVVAVLLSDSRFTSDWETAGRGDIIQMYRCWGRSDCGKNTSPHTTFVQTAKNKSDLLNCLYADRFNPVGKTTGCNWLDSNFYTGAPDFKSNTPAAHDFSREKMMLDVAYSSTYGFTVYQLN
ncbi:MAG: hypothetical protein AAB833_00340 [Patescibacteria group bacterium]